MFMKKMSPVAEGAEAMASRAVFVAVSKIVAKMMSSRTNVVCPPSSRMIGLFKSKVEITHRTIKD